MNRTFFLLAPLFAALLVAGCDENVATGPDTPSRAPRNLSAYSAGDASVALSWTAPSDSSDSTFTGFQVKYAGLTQDFGRNARNAVVSGVAAGEQVFEVVAKRSSGTAESATIRWAPAARFDTPSSLPEYIFLVSTPSGFDVGDSIFNPTALQIEASSQGRMDLYLQAVSDTDSALTFKSARIYNAGWRPTVFSTVSHTAPNLNYGLTAFPAENTFSLYQVRLASNTIYYAKTFGFDGTVHYARLHVQILPGLSFPARRVEVRVSLQRSQGVRSA